MDDFVWVDGSGDQAWMLGGSYLVARRIRIHLEAWDRSTLGDQERTIGRVKASGAPLGRTREHAPLDLSALDSFGEPLIPEDAHIRVAAPATNAGAAILRRGYSFADGVDPTTGELDAGLFFICFQKDPPTSSSPSSSAWPARTPWPTTWSTPAAASSPVRRAPHRAAPGGTDCSE